MIPLWSHVGAGLLLGLQGGFAPGPLTALVISEGIANGRRAGMITGLAPLMTDAPIVAAALLLVSALPGGDFTLGLIACGGAALLVYLGVRGLRAPEAKYAARAERPPTSDRATIAQAVGVNLLNPNPYLFWFTICAPNMVDGYRRHGLAAPVAFMATFYLGLVGVKVSLGFIAGSAAQRLRPRTLMWVNRALSLCMLAYAAAFAVKAYRWMT